MLLQLVYKGRRGGLAAGAVFSACVLDEPDAGVGQVAEQRIELSPEGAAGVGKPVAAVALQKRVVDHPAAGQLEVGVATDRAVAVDYRRDSVPALCGADEDVSCSEVGVAEAGTVVSSGMAR